MDYQALDIERLLRFKRDWAIYFEVRAGAQLVFRRDVYGRCVSVLIVEHHDTARTVIWCGV